jgi:hypothetical protein
MRIDSQDVRLAQRHKKYYELPQSEATTDDWELEGEWLDQY